MKKRHLMAVVLAGLGSFAGLSAAFGQNAPTGGAMQVLDFKPGFDDLMTMLVQPRHIKLHYAGQSQNWELAAFELRELRASFRRSAQTIPTYRTHDVSKAVETMATPQLDRVDKAITARDAASFATAFTALTNSCNACHRVMDHAFLVIQVPGAGVGSQYPDQDFRPAGAR